MKTSAPPSLNPIVKLPGRGNRYQVTRGPGHGTYVCDADAGTCNCRGWLYRHDCCHVQMLFDHLQQQARCPVCEGRGLIALRTVWIGPDGQPVPNVIACIACDGSGLHLAAEAAETPLMLSDQQLRDLFG